MSDRHADVFLNAGTLEETAPAPRVVEDRAYSVAVLGDFSGRGSRRIDGEGLRTPEAILVDRDNLDPVLAGLGPVLRIPLPGSDRGMDLAFEELDDFHPDALFTRLPLFRELRDLRARLLDPATFAAAAAELRHAGGPEGGPGGAEGGPGATGATPDPALLDGILDRIVDEAEPFPDAWGPTDPLTDAGFRSYVRRVLAPHLVADADPRQAELVDHVDAATGEQMRTLLHDPGFQQLEGLWRAVDRLVRGVPTGVLLRLYLVDVTRRDVAATLAGAEPGATPLGRLLATGPEGGSRGGWGLLVADLTLGPDADDLALLGAMAREGARVGVPWIAAAHPGLLGCPSPAHLPEPEAWSEPDAEWAALRRSPDARWVGLALPRLLGRLPYGEDAEACDLFRFEEFDGPADHAHYLWGNPALGCALLLARAFADDGWAMRPGSIREVTGLPLHLVREGGETTALPAAEVWLTERAAERILDGGLMPFASRRDRDAAQLVRFQSMADPVTGLPAPR
jgi:type VI secretion system protein ImpC